MLPAVLVAVARRSLAALAVDLAASVADPIISMFSVEL
jgi:hypothetical protein